MKTFLSLLITAGLVAALVWASTYFNWFGDNTTLIMVVCLVVLACAVVMIALCTTQREQYGSEFDISLVISIGLAGLAVLGLGGVGIYLVVQNSPTYVSQFLLCAVLYVVSLILLIVARRMNTPEILTFIAMLVYLGAVIFAMVVGIQTSIELGWTWYGICLLFGGLITVGGAVCYGISLYNYSGMLSFTGILLFGLGFLFSLVIGTIEGFNSWEGWATILSMVGAGGLFTFYTIMLYSTSNWVIDGDRSGI